MHPTQKINYIHFDVIDSTNTWTKNHAHTLEQDQLTCITAMEQTAGRGRWFRKWVSPRDQNIYASIYFCLPRHSPYIANLSQTLSLSCATALKKQGLHPQIKWPNDLLLEGKKFAGVLCETVSFEDRIGIVLGIGINVNMTTDFLNLIDQPATSLAQLSGHSWTFEQILEPLLHQFLIDLELLKNKGFEALLPAYDEILARKGEQVCCHDGLQPLKGIFHSIDPSGKLNLELPSGQIIKISSGEVLFDL
jgi:BirA family biotin operon repressor/biotin-[acetyl-CoA-carboxylase] ligase